MWYFLKISATIRIFDYVFEYDFSSYILITIIAHYFAERDEKREEVSDDDEESMLKYR